MQDRQTLLKQRGLFSPCKIDRAVSSSEEPITSKYIHGSIDSTTYTIFKSVPLQPWFAKLSHTKVISGDRKIKKPVKLPEDSDGKQPLKEYLMHFEHCAIINDWNEEQASLHCDSRILLTGVTAGRQYSKIVERLQLRFGVEKQVGYTRPDY